MKKHRLEAESYYYRHLEAFGIGIEEIKKAGLTRRELHDLLMGLTFLVRYYLTKNV